MFNKGSGEYNHHMSVYGDPFGNWPYSNFLTHTAYNLTGYYQYAPAQTDDSLKKL
jgi:alpha-L-fucosidase